MRSVAEPAIKDVSPSPEGFCHFPNVCHAVSRQGRRQSEDVKEILWVPDAGRFPAPAPWLG